MIQRLMRVTQITYTITLTNNGPAQVTTIVSLDRHCCLAGVTAGRRPASPARRTSNDDTNPATTGLTWTVNSLNDAAPFTRR